MPQTTSLIDNAACEIAGHAAAYAVCCLFDRQPLVPFAVSRTAENAIVLSVLGGGASEAIVARAERWLDRNPDSVAAAAVVVDAFITMAAGRKDALVIEARSYAPRRSRLKVAVPYRPHHHQGGFAIFRPKFIVESTEGHDLARLAEAFSRGIFAHETGATVWAACVDESW